ncbi:hypothetical protein Droror1_Dr00012310 [Drosera rotundifolia]
MEYLSRRFTLMTSDRRFSFHPKCKRLNISYVCFADDLMVLCKSNFSSSMVVKRALDEFHQVSCLRANSMKSSLFFGGLDDSEALYLSRVAGFSYQKLPINIWGFLYPLVEFLLSSSKS